VLRTCLPDRGGEPVQRVFDRSGPVLTRHQVPDLDEAALRQRVQADADRGFDLERGPLFRVSLYSRGESDHVLLLAMHHTITDFWSLSILVDELLADYADHPQTRSPGLIMDLAARPAGDPPKKLHDQRMRYWREVLAGAPPALDLPTSFPRPRRQSYRGASEPLRIPPEVLRRLDRVAAESGVTRFALLAAGFAAVLARYTGEPDLVIGAPTAGRDGHQHHQLGYFVNPVPLRLRADPAGSFRELAGQVRQAVAGALDHPVPFPRLVEELRPVRDPGRTPILQAMVVLHRAPAGRPDLAAFAAMEEETTLRLAGLELQPYRLADRVAAFDLSVSLAESDAGGLAGELNYATDLFDRPTVARLAGHLTRLVASAAAEPDQPLRKLSLLDEQERAAVLAMATGPVQPVRDHVTLDQLLAEQATRQPDAVAIVAGRGEQRITYAELQRRVDRLAARLVREHRVRPGQLVGVHLPRGPDAIIAFWAALRSGGAYLPLETGLPPDRLAWMLRDARPVVLLTHREVAERTLCGIPPGDRPPLLCLDEPEPPSTSDELSAGSRAGPDDLAYVVYTSGSTGRPKGVMIPHRCVVHLSQIRPPSWEVTPASRVLQFASCAFDVHIADIFTAHTSGAELHLPPEEATVPGPALQALFAERRITFASLSPSVLVALPDTDLPDLTQVMSGGEACTAEVVARWAVAGRRFGNAYGPTETTIGICWTQCRPDGRRPPIGCPNPNSQMYVLDEQMEPVPVGVPGELYLGGAGVGWGYLGRPGLTAERFVPDPFRGPSSRGRLYRTGDRARWLPDGSLDFLGRLDDQVQIRGIRVEPGEVEVRIRELLRIREVAVVPRPGPGGTPELLAYLVAPDPAARPPVPELRARLRAVLPEPWVPAAFVWLDALPLNPSGKLDRWALPEPAPSDRGRAAPVAPRTALERAVAEVWASALEQPAIGVRDHFFDVLGGSSLLVGRVTSELGQRLDRELPMTLLFEHPTVEGLARHLAGEPGSEAPGPAPEDWAARRRRALAARRSAQEGMAE
jgi:amino acid adenylation domain-containing protein